MRSGFLSLLVVACCMSLPAWSQKTGTQNTPANGGDFSNNPPPQSAVPAGAILVKGAWASASDKVTRLPEGGSVINNVFRNQYFGMSYVLPPGWIEKYKGPPPSDSGRYVLAQITPGPDYKESIRGTISISAQDMFFTPLPAANALEFINYAKDNLQDDYKVELPPTDLKIAGQAFRFFAYESPVAELHWYIVATQIRCHTVEIVLTSRDTKLLEKLILDMNKMTLPSEANPTTGTGGGDTPVCIKNYATDEHLIARADPAATEHRFNPVPVRIIIDKEGKVKHIHFLSAFPDQEKAITAALKQWTFKPYVQNGHPVEVETGIMFGRATQPSFQPTGTAATE